MAEYDEYGEPIPEAVKKKKVKEPKPPGEPRPPRVPRAEPAPLVYTDIISADFYREFGGMAACCLAVVFVLSFLWNELKLFHDIPATYDKEKNVTIPGVVLQKKIISNTCQMFYFVAIYTIKIMAWECCWPSYITGLLLKRFTKFQTLAITILATSYSSFLTTYYYWERTNRLRGYTVLLIQFLFTVIMPIMTPTISYNDLHRILKYGNVGFFICFSLFLPIHWLKEHFYYNSQLGEVGNYLYTWNIGTCIYPLVILVQLLETIVCYYVKKEIPKYEPKTTFSILLLTSTAFLYMTLVPIYCLPKQNFCSEDPLCVVKTNITLVESTTPPSPWHEDGQCWFLREKVISSELFIEMFTKKEKRKYLYQLLAFYFHTNYFHPDYDGSDLTSDRVNNKDFISKMDDNEYLLSMYWSPCDAQLETVLKASYGKPRCYGAARRPGELWFSERCMESKWRFLVAQNYYPLPTKVWVKSRMEFHNVPPTNVYRYRKEIHYSQEKRYFKNALLLLIYFNLNNAVYLYDHQYGWYERNLQFAKTDGPDGRVIGFYFLWDIWKHADQRYNSWRSKLHDVIKRIKYFYTVIVVERYHIFMNDFAPAETFNFGQIHHFECMRLLKKRNSIYGFDDEYWATSFSAVCMKKENGKPCKGSTGSPLLARYTDYDDTNYWPPFFGFLVPLDIDGDLCIFIRSSNVDYEGYSQNYPQHYETRNDVLT